MTDATDRTASFAFAKIAPRITQQIRAAGWTEGTTVVVAERGDPIGEVLRRLADARDSRNGRVLLVVPDDGHPDWWHGMLVPATTFIIQAPQVPR